MVVAPPEIPVTKPVELIVATDGLEDVQGLVVAAVVEPVNCEVNPTHENKSPVIVGEGLIVKVLLVAVVVPHSFVIDNETVKVPVVA